MNKKDVAIVLAGGIGVRMEASRPKQFLDLSEKPIIIHTLERFEKNIQISLVAVVCHMDYVEYLDELVKKNGLKKVYKIIPGGETRQESSFIGIKNCSPGTECVLIHDAVRPFIDDKIIEDTLTAAKETGAAGTVIDTADTIVVTEGHFIKEIPDRKNLKRIQTPQGFCYKTITEAHEWALKKGIKDATDDCGLVLAMGRPVRAVSGSVFNIKITDQADLSLAEKFIAMVQ